MGTVGTIARMQTSYLPHVSSTTKFFFPQEKVIPSVVIEPASNNEGEGEHDITMGAEPKEATGDVAAPGPTSETPELATEQKATEDSQPAPPAPSASQASQEVPPGFLYKVLTLLILLNLIVICPSFTVRPFCSNLWFSDFYFYFFQYILFLCTAFPSIPTSHCNMAGFPWCFSIF